VRQHGVEVLLRRIKQVVKQHRRLAPSGRVIADERAKERLYCFRFRPRATEGLAARPGSWRKIAGRQQNWRDAVAAKHGK